MCPGPRRRCVCLFHRGHEHSSAVSRVVCAQRTGRAKGQATVHGGRPGDESVPRVGVPAGAESEVVAGARAGARVSGGGDESQGAGRRGICCQSLFPVDGGPAEIYAE